ncbi:MAG: hypothetical protein ACRDL5_06375, partial [Solirubrobacteraceae bacterium]
ANPGQPGSSVEIKGTVTAVPSCSSGTDATDATTVAVEYAAANGLTIAASQVDVDTSNDHVTVDASNSSKSIFAQLSGIDKTTQSAGAGAGWTASSGSCSNPGTGCDFMFAHNSDCTSSTNGIHLTLSGTTKVQGNIQSNANLSGTMSGSNSLGTATYGPNGNGTCSNSIIWSGSNPWTTAPTQAPADLPYPIDYTKDFPACGGSGELACIAGGAIAGYPSFCTNASATITLTGGVPSDSPVSGNVYCASGTGTKSDPSTWNGSVTITMSGTATLDDTFVGGSVSFTGSGSDSLSPCGYSASGYTASTCSSSVPSPSTTNYPIFYATGTSSSALKVTVSGKQALTGDLFAPNGTVKLTMSGSKTLTTCIEGNNVSGTISGNFLGDGPSGGTTSSGAGGTVTLVQ